MSISANAPIDKLLIRPPEDQPVDLTKFYPCYQVLHVPMVPNDTDVKSGIINIHPNKDQNGKYVTSRPYQEDKLIFMLIQMKLPNNATASNRVDIGNRVSSFPSWDEIYEDGKYWYFTSV